MKWHGIRRGSIDIGPANEGLLAVNTRFKVDGEMRRRRGLARTNLQKRTYPVDAIAGFSPFQANVMATMINGDVLAGDENPYSLWGDNPDYTADSSGSSIYNMTTSGNSIVDASSTPYFGNLPIDDPTGIITSGVRNLKMDCQKNVFTYETGTLSYSAVTTELELDISDAVYGYQVWFGVGHNTIFARRELDGSFRCLLSYTSGSIEYVSTELSSGTHAIKGVADGSTVKLYLDGSLKSSAAHTITPYGSENYGLDAGKFSIYSGGTCTLRYARLTITP